MKKAAAPHRKHLVLHLCVIIAAVLIAYYKVFGASFLNWDDAEYVLHNNDINAISGSNIKAWFSTFYVGNYHPLTMASYAIDHIFGGSQPFVYHLSGVLLHFINSCLVYIFFSKLQQQKTIALAVALLFALHPSQAESVAWVAERKTVLCGFFSLLAMLQYQGYVRRPTGGQMVLLLVFSAFAMLSKGTAVALPVSFLAIDLWLERPLNDKAVWTEKIPVFLMAIITGVVAIYAQQSGHFMEGGNEYGIAEQLVYGGYAYVQYIVRFFLPLDLSAMYPYPEQMGILHIAFAVAAAGMVTLFVIALRRRWQVLAGGILFFTANIAMVLQFIPFGEALMADRYMYMACIGLAYPAMYYLAAWLWQLRMGKRYMYIGGPAAALLLGLCFMRNDVWLSDMNLYNSLLERFPNSAVAQYSAGGMYLKIGDMEQAEYHLDKAVRLAPGNAKAWYNKGLLHMRQGRAMEALEALDRSIAINDYTKAHFSRALLHLSTGKPDLALTDIDHVLRVQPGNARAWCIKGDCMERMGRLEEALNNYNKAIERNAGEPLFYVRRGATYCKLERYAPAITDLDAALDMDASNGEAYYWRAIAKQHIGQGPCSDLQNAMQRRYAPAKDALQKLCK
ncbi:tetratricopeptide repeat protein [Nemorincola caseinilytica]|uniref:Tetratricopeptide repeat protein n=1 Tax=Nemorincola caseinilytica TaxID=2054315 RepID=A0ABP8N5H5_9BACT